ncbi:hypothetical protein DB346_08415 [Verrucomicrobia bacterium LW23]|nr:hypothetical protein DB346_08415 [Verrucomicrobia bacterium LW23]
MAPYLPDPNGTYHLEVALDPGGGIRSWQGSTGTWTLSLSCLGGNYELVIDLSGDVVAFMALGHRGLSTPFIGDAPTEASCGDGSGFGGVRIAYGGTVTVTVTEETEE